MKTMKESVQARVPRLSLGESPAAKRAGRIALLLILSLGGSMVRLPLPTGPVALETFPGFYAALAFGWADGAMVAGLGHLIVAALGGFPLGIWLHLVAGFQMALWAACFWYLSSRAGLVAGIIAITLLHSLVSVVYTLPIWNMVIFSGLLGPLAVAAAVNLFLAAFIFQLARKKREGNR